MITEHKKKKTNSVKQTKFGFTYKLKLGFYGDVEWRREIFDENQFPMSWEMNEQPLKSSTEKTSLWYLTPAPAPAPAPQLFIPQEQIIHPGKRGDAG